MVVAGLTGGIATGKSTVACFFQSAGAVLIDADRIAFEAVQKGTPAWHEIVDHFGAEVLLGDGQINRARLGDIIFNDHDRKAILDRIVHPRVFEEIERQLLILEKDLPGSVVIVDVPLLMETGMDRAMPEVIVVYVPESIQIERLMARDCLCREDALARIRSQMSIEEKKARASIIIDNSHGLEQTRARTLEVFNELQTR